VDSGNWDKFWKFWEFLDDHSDEHSREVLMPYISAKMYDIDIEHNQDEIPVTDEIKGDLDGA
jgi:hypothetical protein